VEFQAWDFAPGQVPPGFRLVLRARNLATNLHFLTTDPTGAGRGSIEGPVGYLAVDAATARASSRSGCSGEKDDIAFGPSEVTEWEIDPGDREGASTGRDNEQAPPPGSFLTSGSRKVNEFSVIAGRKVELLGYQPCR
jgi:hypothetical protein